MNNNCIQIQSERGEGGNGAAAREYNMKDKGLTFTVDEPPETRLRQKMAGVTSSA